MDILSVSIRTIFFYFFIIIVFRLMGKREIGELSLMDLVVSLLIAELVAISIENYDESIFLTIIPISILLIFEIIFGYFSIKFEKFRTLIDGKPSLIINKGKINKKEMKRQRYSLDDLMLELRNNNIEDLTQVNYAILENNGKLNIYKNNTIDIPFPLILDGCIQKDTLNYINKDLDWLIDNLDNKNLNIEDIFYAFYKDNKVYVIKTDELA